LGSTGETEIYLDSSAREAACGRAPDDYSQTEVRAWLSEIGLRQFASAFEKYAVNGDTMRELEVPYLEGVVDHPLYRAKIVGGWKNLRSNYADCTKQTQK
jgi:hypothetical protein